MEDIKTRATDMLPSVVLTVLSMIQALALELLWSRLGEASFLWSPGWDAVLGWVQVGAMMLGVLQVWLFYTSLVMRFRWLPSMQDSVVPFVIGVLEFTLIDLMGPETLGPWFLVLAIVFGVSIWASQSTFRRARQEPSNRQFFESVRPATLRDFAPTSLAIAGLALLGLLLQLSGNRSWLALGALWYAVGMLAFQVHSIRNYWGRAIAGDSPSPEP